MISLYKKIRNYFNSIDLIKAYDCVYLTYDEPEKDERYLKIKEVLPKLKRVDGVKGFDAAHRQCASLCQTPRVVVIDGDNVFKNGKPTLVVDKTLVFKNYVLSFSAENSLNGLIYGNGGIKCWPRQMLLNIKGHELSEDNDVDFIYSTPYYQIPEVPTLSLVNLTPFQAFRAGYREGMKLALEGGQRLPIERVELEKLDRLLVPSNFFRLKTWLEVGRDCDNGLYGILGARLGLYHLYFDEGNLEEIKDYDWFKDLWSNYVNLEPSEIEGHLLNLATNINGFLLEPLRELSATESISVKKNMENPRREGLLKPTK